MRVEGLVLAAGLSSRLPEYKMIQKINGTTILERTIMSMYPYCERIVVVGGHRYQEIKSICSNYHKTECVENKDYRKGMFSSILHGVKSLDCGLFFMMPGDMPAVMESTFTALLDEEGEVRIPSYKFRAGHPILLSGELIEELNQSVRFNNMRDFISTRAITYVNVDDDGILIDIDTRDDLERLKRRNRNEDK